MQPDFTLMVKKKGIGVNAKFDFSWVNSGGFTRNELVAFMKAAIDYFENIDRAEATRLWGTTVPKFRPRSLDAVN